MSYIGNQPSGQGQAERFIFTATGTTPTITHDDDGLPISYVANHVSVYLNGVKQVIPTDVAASNGSTVVFASDLVVSDVVEVIALSTFSAANITGAAEMATFSKLLQNPDTISANITIASGYSAIAGGPINFTGTVAVNGNLSIV